MVAAINKARYQKEMAAQSWIGNMGKGGVVLAFFSAKKGQYYSNHSRKLCFMIKTVHAGLKVDTQVLKLLRILFVEHYKHTLLNNIRLILLVKVRMTYVGNAVRSEIVRSTGCGQICINGYAVSQRSTHEQ